MKQTQLICDLCHDVIMEYALPGQLTCGRMGLGSHFEKLERMGL